MGRTEAPAEHPATSDEMTAALNAALEAGDLNSIMGIDLTPGNRSRTDVRILDKTGDET